ncbi:3'(2'),5'-bisphosphate nucleotidase CysQ family protein [Limnoglobus roseus]|uniref:3'(2'),5'-bisphosphate nucleotidase CysQ n=1 Tax=Limnoglobus roseus TaxID=2598579 RepID=A0A5C1AC08_9BACT|nr:inositol monophosphatase family protein [Limnoglobus roseus]QEL15727.1 3'(2'),5'-bisphosphate nucleotidase CysQ [Limnoglobus roseus]
MNLEHELAVALAAAERAGQFIRTEYESFTPIPNAPATISTHVDKGSQDLIMKFLHEKFPHDGLCGEEDTGTPKAAAADLPTRVWVVDPIDGTRGFAMKNGEFSAMIGLTINREVVLGVVLEPTTMKYTYATKGGGCWTKVGEAGTPTRCSVRPTTNPDEVVLVQSRPGKKDSPTAVQKALQPAKTLEMYSAGVKLAVVARGEADVYVNTYGVFRDWDICAGHVLVTEAGGVVTGFGGEAITYGAEAFAQKLGLVAGGPGIHAAVVEKLKAV